MDTLTSCLWSGCGKQFDSIDDLSAHVNSIHLNFQSSSIQAAPSHVPSIGESTGESTISTGSTTFQSLDAVVCRWDNCNRNSIPPIDPTVDPAEFLKEFLAQHVQQEHLGICSETATSSMSSQTACSSSSESLAYHFSTAHDGSSIQESSSSDITNGHSTMDASNSSSDPAFHLCQWQSCPMSSVLFQSAMELTQHITDAHVGTGHSRYHCLWEGCNRNGELGFSSKQKILRHIQSHTGELLKSLSPCYRPYKCEECNQYFSEAATLQQHMRRHTKEKPYVCDFPGCGKAFAITGALTIHKRVHSGSKPFKCPHCDRSFSESSNLSKHVRTHTGDRPYACPYPGCSKRFARPDQFTRHKNVHAKREKMQDGIDVKFQDTGMMMN
ncbi:hypothetical protein M422DRAFT_152240 [Sphaerobolus stellatus SS14]|nr:hypothetical protein M422DRAFT_152240 [Sphaerobolus stellatus SS14]